MCLTKYTTKKINSKIVFGDVPDVSAETLDVRRKYSTKIYIDIEHNINMFQTTEQTMLNKHPHAHTVCKQTNVLSKETKRTGLDRMNTLNKYLRANYCYCASDMNFDSVLHHKQIVHE